MAHRWGRAIMCVLLILVLLARSSTADCSFEYRKQPPSTTLSDCNPYMNNDRIDIVLECTVRRMEDISTAFTIRWFRENTTGAVEDLGLGDPDQPQGPDWFSRYHNTAFRTQSYSPSLLGKYWCQVINTTADPDQPLMRSNVFTLLAPGDYRGSMCPGTQKVQQEMNETCADQPTDQTSPPTTSTHSPILVLPSSTSIDTHTTALSPTISTSVGVVGPRHSSIPDTDSSTPRPTILLSPQEGVPPYLYAVASIGAIFLVIIIVLVVGIVIMLTMKKRSKGGEGTINNTYGMNTPEDYAEPVTSLPRSPPADGSGDAVYDDVGTTPQHVIQNGFVYSVVTKKPSEAPVQHSPYSRLDHSLGPSCSPPASNEVYSSVEDSTAPVYNTLQLSQDDHKIFDDPDYSNIAEGQQQHSEGGEVHPHYIGDYERATDYQPPILPTASNGIYEMDPHYQAIST